MTERLAETTRRIGNLHQLETVVTAMRGISASRAQQAHVLLRGLRTHTSVIAEAIGQALRLGEQPGFRTARRHRTACIVFCADQGFVGGFTDRVLDTIGDEVSTRDIFLVGLRGAALANERRISLHWHTAMVPHPNLITTLTERVADALYDWLSDQAGYRVEVIVPTWSSANGVVVEKRSLLPFDYRRFAVATSGQPPLSNLPPAQLLGLLAQEYVFAELCEAALTAFVAENAARVSAMLMAKTNLADMRSTLQAVERQIRQEEITAEVVELASASAGPGR